MKNQINTSEGNVQFITPDGKLMNVHPSHVYAVFNQDTVSFLLIAMPKSSGLAVFTTTAEDLLFNGETYTFEQLKTVIPEAFAEAGAQARCEIVDELPETGKTNTIYLVPKEEGEGYDEYIYLKDEQRWELIGDTSIEMDNYVKKVDFSAYTASTQEVIDGLVSDLEAESANRISGDSQLSTAIENEAQRAVSAETALDEKIDELSGNVYTKNEVYTKTEVDGIVSGKADTSAVTEAITAAVSGKADTSAVTEAITAAVSGKADADSVYTKDEVYTKAEVDEAIAEIDLSDYYTKDETDDLLATKAELSAVTEDERVLGEAINDLNTRLNTISGESMTSGDVETMIDEAVSGKADTSAVTEAITAAVSGKADTSAVTDVISDVETISGDVETIKGDAVVDAEYVSSSTTIDFKNASGDVVAQVDASDFIVDGMVEDVRIENGYLVIDFNTASGKQDISIPLTDIFNPSNYYTKAETDTLLSAKADTATTYTKTEVDAALANKADTSAVTEAITAAVSAKQDTLVSGTNIKTINNTSILGSGNIDIQGGGKEIVAGRGIAITTGETADTVSFNLPISAGTGNNSVIFGDSKNEAKGACAFAGGSTSSILKNEATKEASFAFGKNCKATGSYSHAEGNVTKANGDASHAEGYDVTASGSSSHAEGLGTKANGSYSHAEGGSTTANGEASHAEGYGTTANNATEHASGRYNNSVSASTTFGDSGNTLFSVGNGTADNARHNAFEIRQNGDIYITLDGSDVKLQDQLGGGSSYTAGSGIDITNDVISVTGKVDTADFNTYSGAVESRLAEDEEVTAFGINAVNDKFGGLKLMKITQAEYDALTVKDNNTLYIISD